MRGYRAADDFLKEAEEVAQIHREFPELQSKFEADPSDLATGGMLASVYAFRGEATKAKRCIKVVEQADPDNEQGHLTEAYMAIGEYYDEKEDFGKAAKFFTKAADSSEDPLIVADARFNTARAHFRDRARFDLGSPPAEKRLDAAEQALAALLAMTDLPQEQRQQADELRKAIESDRTEHDKGKADIKGTKKKQGGRR
jgi:tetratricopeptide (TPR) repeat protein